MRLPQPPQNFAVDDAGLPHCSQKQTAAEGAPLAAAEGEGALLWDAGEGCALLIE
jgi:hypothetical protein